ncbi:MAG: hypothetical protein V4695_06735 [Pseudomonadota bacterium]
MFESLDANLLNKLSGFDNSLSEKNDTLLEEFLACLENGRKECFSANASGKFGSMELRQIGEGFTAAQQIVSHLWAKKGAE